MWTAGRDAPNRGNRICKPPGAWKSLARPQVERPVRVEWEKGFWLDGFACKQQKTFFVGTGTIKICIIPWRECCQVQGRFSCSAKSIRTCSPHHLPSSVCACVCHHGTQAPHPHPPTSEKWEAGIGGISPSCLILPGGQCQEKFLSPMLQNQSHTHP